MANVALCVVAALFLVSAAVSLIEGFLYAFLLRLVLASGFGFILVRRILDLPVRISVAFSALYLPAIVALVLVPQLDELESSSHSTILRLGAWAFAASYVAAALVLWRRMKADRLPPFVRERLSAALPSQGRRHHPVTLVLEDGIEVEHVKIDRAGHVQRSKGSHTLTRVWSWMRDWRALADVRTTSLSYPRVVETPREFPPS